MNPSTDLFLSLLLPEPDIRPVQAPPEEIKGLSMRHGLFPLIYRQITRHRQALDPGLARAFLQDFHPLFLKSVALSAVQESLESEVLTLLGKASIPAVLIKGNMIARRIYGDPNCRVSSDIDVLIRLDDASSTEEVLLREGFIPEEGMPLRYCLGRIHHVTYIHPLRKIPLEIHWNFGIPYLFDLASEDIWREVQEDGQEGLTLSDEMLLIMLLVHHHSHSFRELKILVDILWSLYRFRDVLDPSGLSERLDRFGLSKVGGLVFRQIEGLWPGYLRQKGIEPLARRLEGRMPGKILIKYFNLERVRTGPDPGLTQPVHLYRDKLLARFLLKNPVRTALSFLRTLFPPGDAIEALYGKTGLMGLFINYIRFVLWRVSDWLRFPTH